MIAIPMKGAYILSVPVEAKMLKVLLIAYALGAHGSLAVAQSTQSTSSTYLYRDVQEVEIVCIPLSSKTPDGFMPAALISLSGPAPKCADSKMQTVIKTATVGSSWMALKYGQSATKKSIAKDLENLGLSKEAVRAAAPKTLAFVKSKLFKWSSIAGLYSGAVLVVDGVTGNRIRLGVEETKVFARPILVPSLQSLPAPAIPASHAKK